MQQKRNCLRCDSPFQSSGRGNRICPKCKGSDATAPPAPMPAALRKTVKKQVRAKVGGDHWNPLDLRYWPVRAGRK